MTLGSARENPCRGTDGTQINGQGGKENPEVHTKIGTQAPSLAAGGMDVNVLFLQFMIEMMKQHLTGIIEPRQEVVREVEFSKMKKYFKNYGGKEFTGKESSLEILNWMKVSEHIFKDMGYNNAQKMRLASHRLQEDA